MSERNADFVQHTIEFLILSIVSAEPRHSFGIEQQFDQITRGFFRNHRPSFPATLLAMERTGWLEAEWREVEDLGRVKIYSMSPMGKEYLESEWIHRRAAVAQYFGGAGLPGNFKRSDPANWN